LNKSTLGVAVLFEKAKKEDVYTKNNIIIFRHVVPTQISKIPYQISVANTVSVTSSTHWDINSVPHSFGIHRIHFGSILNDSQTLQLL